VNLNTEWSINFERATNLESSVLHIGSTKLRAFISVVCRLQEEDVNKLTLACETDCRTYFKVK